MASPEATEPIAEPALAPRPAMPQRALRFLRTLAHHEPAQVGRRALALAQRHGLVFVQRCVPVEKLVHGRGGPELSAQPPQPLFAERRDLAIADARGTRACFLGIERELRTPMDWHPGPGGERPLLETMHLHYMEWLEALDDATVEHWIRDWTLHVRPYRPGYWRDSWNPYAVSIRCVVWMQLLARRGHAWSAEFRELLRESLCAQVRFLARNLEHDIGGNHLVKNLTCLLWASRTFDGPEARAWGRLGTEILARELERQILPDGMHFERSPAYHAQVFADLCECLHLSDDGPSSERLASLLATMAQALADTTHPDGLPSQFGDGALHMGRSPQECLAVFELLGGRRCEPRAAFALPQAGYFGARERDSFVLADCGSIGAEHLPAHGHGDALAFEWSLDGERFLVDAGVSEYRDGPWRAWSRSTRAHNTLTLDGADQCEFHGSFRIGRRARVRVESFELHGSGFRLAGSHDGYAHLPGRPRHRRELTVDARGIQVLDHVEGGEGQQACARLLLHPSVRFERTGDTLVLRRGDTVVRLECDHPVTVADAWWCPDMGVRVATRQLTVWYGAAPMRGGFRLRCTSTPRRQPSRARVQAAGVSTSASSRLGSTVARGAA